MSEKRSMCTVAELKDWVGGLRTLGDDEITVPDCLGCGEPIGEAYPVIDLDDQARTVKFTWCGCALKVEGPWDELAT